MSILLLPAHEPGDAIGTLTKWHKKPGDWVMPGDRLFSYHTNSGSYVSISEQEGRLSAIYLQEGGSAALPADVALLLAAERPKEPANEDEEPLFEEEYGEEPFIEDDPESLDEEEDAGEEWQEEEIPPSAPPGLYIDRFDATRLESLLKSLEQARKVFDDPPVGPREILIYAALLADWEYMGLGEYAELSLGEVAAALGDEPEGFSRVRCCRVLFAAPACSEGGPRLTMGRLSRRTAICLQSDKGMEESEAFLLSLKEILAQIDRHI